jgi:Transposase and inactivated derivatives
MTTPSESYVGIDVGKTWLDVALWGSDEAWRVSNDEAGVAKIMEWIKGLKPRLIAVEATGGYEQLAVQTMLLDSQPVAVVNPTRVRALSKATGKLAKTDVIDARLIAEYAFKIHPEAQEPKEANEIRLNALVTRREQLVVMRTAEQNRLGTVLNSLRADVDEHIEWMDVRITELEEQINELIDSLPEWREQAERLDSIPGVGMITAMTVLAEMPELGQLDRQKIAALAGLAPFNNDSGKKRGKRRIFGGRKGIRRVLYMACLSATKCNPVIRSLYQRLMNKGKLFKVALTACMHKMLTIMNAMTRDRVDWRAPKPSPI